MVSGSPGDSAADTLYRMAVGFRNTQALYVAANLGVADLLAEGPLGSRELSKRLGVNARALFRVMRALAAQGVFAQDSSDRFGLTPISQLLQSDTPDSMRYIVISYGERQYEAAGQLIHTVRTGETAFDHIYGKGLFDYLSGNEESNMVFNLFMAQSHRRTGEHLGFYDFSKKKLIVDVGGGQGHLIAHLLKLHAHLGGILYDLPQGVRHAAKYLEEQEVSDRCRVVTGSFFDSVPKGGDVYLLSRILHDWPDEKAGQILQNCRKAIGSGGVLLIMDAVIPEGDAPHLGKQVDLQMLFLVGGMERTEREWRRLLESSGFALNRVTSTGTQFDVIEASPI